ncbi:hypothetical protein BHM03_00011076 [Ensete ventricosum]|nr:hypothetical protein BHM03_00011076 [Ensete ventricosum]
MYVRVFRVLFILCTTTSGLALGSEGLSTGQEDTKAGTLEEYAHYCHSSCHEESGAQRRLCSCGIEAHDPDSDALIIAKSGDFESMIGAAKELDCSGAHICLRELDKSEDKAEGVEASSRKGRGSDAESRGAQLPKSKASVRKEVDSEECYSAVEADLPIVKKGT